MKKNIFLLALSGILSITACAQDNSQAKRLKVTDCPMHGIDLGTTGPYYLASTENGIDSMKDKLNILLNCKDIELCRQNNQSRDAWFTLMRIRNIKWTTHKAEILNYLDVFFKQIINEKSYLNKQNRNMLFNDKGCRYNNGDPISIPFACFWATLKIDSVFAVKLIDESWEQIKEDEPFSNEFRSSIIYWLKEYYKNLDVQLLLKKIEQSKMTASDISDIELMMDKFEFFNKQNQLDAWNRFIKRSLTKSSENLFTESNMIVWMNNMGALKEVFGNVDITIPLKLAEQEKNIRTKYLLAYSCCWLINNMYPNKSDKSLLNRIDKLVNSVNIEIAPLKKGTKEEVDYLKESYQTLKKWH